MFRIGEEILHLLDGVDVVAHNAAFEISHLEHAGDRSRRSSMHDARRQVDARRTRHVARRCSASLFRDRTRQAEQTSDWSTPHLTKEQLEYAARDASMAFNLSKRIFPALGAQTAAYEIQIAAVPAAARMQRRGIRLDLDAHAKFIEAKESSTGRNLRGVQGGVRRHGATSTWRRIFPPSLPTSRPCSKRS